MYLKPLAPFRDPRAGSRQCVLRQKHVLTAGPKTLYEKEHVPKLPSWDIGTPFVNECHTAAAVLLQTLRDIILTLLCIGENLRRRPLGSKIAAFARPERIIHDTSCCHAACSHPFEYGFLQVFSSSQLSWYYLAWPFGLQFPIREASRRPSPRPPLVEQLRWMEFLRLLPSQPMPRRPSHPGQEHHVLNFGGILTYGIVCVRVANQPTIGYSYVLLVRTTGNNYLVPVSYTNQYEI